MSLLSFQECGCVCARCTKNNNKHISDVHLHAEIEHLRQSLMEKNSHIVKIETEFLNEADKFPNGELASMKEEINTWQEKYARLFEAHKRIQKVNQNLEDKLLKIVDKCETEKGAFTKDIATLSHRLADANYTIHRLSQDNSKYRNDVNLAIQLLQCKPSNFVGQKYDSLPTEVQAKVRNYVAQKRRSSTSDQSLPDVKSITVPISTFPPTAMVYNISKANVEKHSDDESDDDKPPVDMVSAAIMAKVLEDRERERIFAKHCDTCVCHKTILMIDSETQTITSYFTDNVNQKMYVAQKNDDIKRSTFNKTGVCTKINQNLPAHIKIERQSKVGVINKVKQNKPSKRIETQTDIKVNPRCSDDINDTYDASPVEIINDRIWKNNWAQSKFDNLQTNNGNDNKRKDEIHLEVINERIWKKDTGNINNINQVTLIEVTNAVNANHQTSDTAASPSFSSDSVLISSSEPSSSSSDLVQSINEKRRLFNNNSMGKERLTGPRNCLVRVSREGSKNILLDNAGHYQTVLYTSPGSGSGSTKQTNTALVHNLTKSARSDRSLSTSSDEAFPILQTDATQLQRVAEWVQSSASASGKTSTDPRVVATVVSPPPPPPPSKIGLLNTKNTKPTCTLIEMPTSDDGDFTSRNIKSKIQNPFEVVVSGRQANLSSSIAHPSSIEENINIKSEIEVKDLISFDSNNEDENEDRMKEGEPLMVNETDDNYEVKITKEMEETYLKLAASLDPVSLRLSTGINADLTIEKYRKDHKRFQAHKINEKSGTTT